jgi:redox-sensitive bicupin YhaK (pirin superfamily)
MKGFPWHPHRGIETVTYLLEKNVIRGGLGNEGVIREGQCQWMTAGSGIIHQEMMELNNRLTGLQFWVNLPAKDKMTPPKYRDIKGEDIPVIEEGDFTVKLIAGSYKGRTGPMEEIAVKPSFMDVIIKEGKAFNLDTVFDHTVFLYILEEQYCLMEVVKYPI